MSCSFLRSALVVGLVCASVSWTHARWTSTAVPVCDAPYDQLQVAGCEDGAGGLILVWKDQRIITYGIYAQRVSYAGDQLWTDDGVRLSAHLHSCWNPAVAADGNGGAWVVWEDRANPYGDLVLGHVHANGLIAPGGGTVIRAGTTWFTPCRPRAVADGEGGVVVVFVEEIPGSTAQVVAQHFDATGAPQWTTPAVVIGDDIEDGGVLDVDSHHPLGTGALVAWVNSSGQGRAQWVDDTGTPRWFGTSGYGTAPLISGTRVRIARRERSTGGAYLLHQLPSNFLATTFWRVKGFEDNLYERVSEDFGTHQHLGPDASIDHAYDGGFVVGWYDLDLSGDHQRVWGQMVEADGDVVWTQYLGQGTPVSGGVAPVVRYTNTSFGHRFVWPLDVGGIPTLYYRTMGRLPGQALPDPGGAPLPGTCSSAAPVLVAHGELSDLVFVAWRDEHRLTETDVYVNLFGPSAATPTSADPPPRSLGARWLAPRPNPFNPNVTLPFEVVWPSQLSITVFDLAGRHVAHLGSRWWDSGQHSVRWDGRDDLGRRVGSGAYMVEMRGEDVRDRVRVVLVE